MRLFNPDSTHWYTRKGEPMHTVIDRKGNERPTDLRDARKLDLLPSVTNVLGVIAKDALVQWKLENAVLSALTLPRAPGESLDSFAVRVAEDAKSRVGTAAEFGTAFHAGAERVARNPLDLDSREPLYEWLKVYREWFAGRCERVVFTERVLVSERYGYAGTADLCMVHKEHGLVLVDLKTQGVQEKRLPRIYGSWLYQLAAYRGVLGAPCRLMNLVVNSRVPEPPVEHVWNEEESGAGWEVFQAAHLIWRNEKGYEPRIGRISPKFEARVSSKFEVRSPKGEPEGLGRS